ncbi:MAG: FmdB family zinc ribbon protein [Acidobacteriota bacterium]
MPLYEYQCQSCGYRLEALQKFSDPPLTDCEECGGQLKKLISAPAVQFKGTGWYVTDYAGKKSGGDKGSSGSSPDGGDKASSGGESSGAPKGGGDASSSSGAGKSAASGGD